MKQGQNSTKRHIQSVPLAIIGIGCIFPHAQNLNEYWVNIREGVDTITDVPPSYWKAEEYFDSDPKTPDHAYAMRGAFLPEIDFNPLEFGIVPNALEATDTSQLLSLVAAQEALKDAGYSEDRDFDRDRVSVILGVTGTLEMVIPLGARLGHPIWRRALKEAGIADDVSEDVIERIRQQYVEWQEASFPGLLGNVIAGRIANRFDFCGTNCTVDAACASSLSALHLAGYELASGKADMVLTGGVDTFNHVFMYMCFSKTPALSPSGHSRPFDHQADGTTLGEGIGIIALKRLEDAQRDQDKIYAVIRGIGSSSDGKGTAIYAPNAAGQIKAFRSAYRSADVTPDTIELMEAHGTGTKVGDATEIQSMTEVYREVQKNGSWCALGSVKSQIGHTKSAAGIAGLIKTALALHHKVLPPTIKVEQPAPGLDNGDTPFYVNTQKRPWLSSPDHPRRAAISAFGFGGSNFHCVLEETDNAEKKNDWSGYVQILPFAADTPANLQRALEQIDPALDWRLFRSKAAQLRRNFDRTRPHRVVFVVEKGKIDLAKMINNAKKMFVAQKGESSWSTPDGIYYAQGDVPGGLGIIFPGQGSQYIGMLRDLACQFHQFQDILDTANQVFQRNQDDPRLHRLSDLIYPHPTFTEEAHQKNAVILQSTQVAQPAIGAVSLGLLKILEYFGVYPESVAGHSYGELVALCAAGVLDTETFFALSKLRGQLMGQRKGDKGSMLAVQGDAGIVTRVMQEEQLDLVLANKNSPQQTVLSGATGEIERARDIFKRREFRCKQLSVAAAFHSRFVADASGTFLEALQQVEIHPPQLPVFADSTAELYPENPTQIREILAGQLANPVEFIQIVEKMYDRGIRTFVEVGPSAQMSGLAKSILEGKLIEVLSVDASMGQRSGETDLARALGQLAALGYNVNLSTWDDAAPLPAETPQKRAMTVKLRGINYIKPHTPKPPVKTQEVTGTMQLKKSKTRTETAPMVGVGNSVHPPKESRAEQSFSVPSDNSENMLTSSAKQASDKLNMSSTESTIVQLQHSEQPQQVQPHNMDIAALLQITQENLRTLQQFQQQTADLHRQFLEGQDAARQSFDRLLEQQQRLMQGLPVKMPVAHPEVAKSVKVQSEIPSTPQQPATPTPPVPKTPEFHQPVDTKPEATQQLQSETPVANAQSNNGSNVATVLLDVVAEKTGYPADMLDLEMGLDADLGIDSIKRVEILSALREQLPQIPEIGSQQIGGIQTLGQIVNLFGSNGGAVSAVTTSAPETPPIMTDPDNLETILLDVVSEKTGYPADMLDLEMGLDADLGIDSIKRVEILSALREQLPQIPEIGSEQIGGIQTLGQIVKLLGSNGGPASTATTLTRETPVTTEPDDLEAILLDVVAEKTGYPADMLDLEMGLDADLGIDSIKRVEILSALREQLPQIPEIGSQQIGGIQTLGQIVKLLGSNGGPASTATTSAPETPSFMTDPDNLEMILLDVVAEKTGYPADMLDLEMGLDADLGIDSIKRVEILSALREQLPQIPEIGSQQIGGIQTLCQIVELLEQSTPTPERISQQQKDSSNQAIEKKQNESDVGVISLNRSVVIPVKLLATDQRSKLRLPVGSTIWLTDDTTPLTAALADGLQQQGFLTQVVAWQDLHQVSVPDTLGGLIILAPPAENITDDFLRDAFLLLQKAGPGLRDAGAQQYDSMCMTVSRLDGKFGFGDTGTRFSPVSGGLAGLVKTAAHEWPDVSTKALDLDTGDRAIETAAAAILEEFFCAGPVEVGFSSNGRIALELQQKPFADIDSKPVFDASDVIIITGGARGVTAECAVALASAWKPTLILFGRSPEPASEPDWLSGVTDAAAIKKAILAQTSEKMTPKAIEQRYREIMAHREIRTTLSRIEKAGARAHYYSVDVRDAEAVERMLVDVQQQLGTITGIVHGAGVLADKRIEDKTLEQFERVYSTKVKGLQVLLNTLQTNPLKAIAIFSSTTARLGRVGQVDYAVANEVLNKIAQQQARLRPECRVVSVNWGPWDGGMVTPALKDLFAQEGIGVIPLQGGAQYLVKELAADHSVVEAVVLNGELVQPEKVVTEEAALADTPLLSVAFERTLDLEEHPFLRSHVINGQAVLPVAISLEWMAHGALHSNPGLRFYGFNDFKILKGVILSANESYTIRVLAGKPYKTDGYYAIPVEMQGLNSAGQEVLHTRAECLLSAQLPEEQPIIKELATALYPHKNGDIYRKYLFHGPDFQGIQEVEGCSPQGIIAKTKAAPRPSAWIKQPLRSRWLTDPLAVDSSFQMLILWSFQQYQAGSLPTAVGRYRQFQSKFPAQGGRVVAQIVKSTQNQAVANIEFLDQNGTLVARIENYECVIDPSLNEAFQRNTLSGMQEGA